MRIRAQIALAFVALSVVPLTGLVLYSYVSSTRAVRETLAADAARSTREMQERLNDIERDLGRGVVTLRRLPADGAAGSASDLEDLKALAAAVPFLRSIELLPRAPAGAAPEERRILFDMSKVAREVVAAIPENRPKERAEAEKALNAVAGVVGAVFQGIDAKAPSLPAPPEAPLAPPSPTVAPPAPRAAPAPPSGLPGRFIDLPFDLPGSQERVRAQLESRALLDRVYARARTDDGEIPFVLDGTGQLHTRTRKAKEILTGLGLPESLAEPAKQRRDDWLVVTSKDEKSGLTFGMARRIGESLDKVQQTAVANFGWGLGLIGLALLGILPLSRRMTHGVQVVTEGAERIAGGDLATRVPVLSRNEIGQLAASFNHMAEVLVEQRQRLVEEERQRREIELAHRLFESELARKTAELDEARQFQLSLLPKVLPRHPRYAVAASMQTATEVGGDYYDFHLSSDGALTVAIGDATGHGVKAGTLVTVVKSLFSAYGDVASLSTFLSEASAVIQRMGLDRMLMSATLVRFEGEGMILAAAGMPPVLVYRAGGTVEEVDLPGMPLGGIAFDYREKHIPLSPGDAVLLMTDGLPESPGEDDAPLGYAEVSRLFGRLGAGTAEEIVAGLNAAAAARAGEGGLADDVTFVVVKVREAG